MYSLINAGVHSCTLAGAGGGSRCPRLFRDGGGGGTVAMAAGCVEGYYNDDGQEGRVDPNACLRAAAGQVSPDAQT